MNVLELWQGRQIRRLLNLIDHLPRNSRYSEAVSNDPEHMRMLLDAGGGPTKNARPPMSSWTPEVEAITGVADLLKALLGVTIMANSKKGAKKPDLAPALRPGTVLSEIERQRKRERHRMLVAKMLPKAGEEASE